MLEKEILDELKEIKRDLKHYEVKVNTLEFYLKKISDHFEVKK